MQSVCRVPWYIQILTNAKSGWPSVRSTVGARTILVVIVATAFGDMYTIEKGNGVNVEVNGVLSSETHLIMFIRRRVEKEGWKEKKDREKEDC